ncbi:MAG: GAF domain-containing protein [Chloroflexota bacterium]|jgi:GAF domain-containing protein
MLEQVPSQTDNDDKDPLLLQTRLRQAEALVKFNQLLTTTIDVPEIYRRATRLMAEELDCSQSFISILDSDQSRLLAEIEFVQPAESSGRHNIQSQQFDLDSYPSFQQVLETQEAALHTVDETNLSDQERTYFTETGQTHCLLLPIVQDGRSRGLIHLYRTAGQPSFSDNSQGIAQTMATQLGFTLRNALFASEARARAAQLSTVNRINTLLSIAPSLREVLEGARREIFALVEATGMSIVMLAEEVEKFRWLYAYEHGQEVDLSQIPLLPVTQGFSGQVYKNREVMVFNKALNQKSKEFESITIGAQPSIWAGFPLVVANKFIGILTIENEFDSDAFNEYDIQLLETISSPIAIAINNLIQFEQIQEALIIQSEQRLQLQTASEVAAATSSIRDLNELMQQTVNLIQERFTLYYVGLFLIDPETKDAVLRAGTGKAGRLQMARNHCLRVGGKSLIGGATQDSKPRIIQDVTTAEEWLPNPLLPNTRSEMALPLRVRERVIGALTVQSATANAFDLTLISTLQTMSDQLAVAIENAQLLRQAETRAQRQQQLNQISATLHRTADIDEIIRMGLGAIAEQLDGTPVKISLGTTRPEIVNQQGD